MDGLDPVDRQSALSSDVANAVAVAERIAAACSRALGEIVASVILHGSLALGDYTPGQSDIDLLTIIDRPLGRAERDLLVRALAAEQADAPAGIDVRVVTREVAAAPPEIPPMELYVRLDPGTQPEVVSEHPGEPDLIVELSLCKQRGKALLGPPAPELIGDVPDSWVLRAGDAQLARWQRLTGDAQHAALMVLTACRIWCFSELRKHCSKSAAARWALTRDPSLQAVHHALRQRAGNPAPIAPADVARALARAKVATSRSLWPPQA